MRKTKTRKNFLIRLLPVLVLFTTVGHDRQRSPLGKLELKGGGPVLDWGGGRECEGRWWWLMARTWIQAPLATLKMWSPFLFWSPTLSFRQPCCAELPETL